MINELWLPEIFFALMGLAVLVYAILDGYDLGVGILLPMGQAEESRRDAMIASIGPFWDANETWLVLAVGLLLIAFPKAHSIVLFHLYLPAAFMLIGLILRGVAFDFRAKAAIDHKLMWDRIFKIGSIVTAVMQGYMLGQYIMGFELTWPSISFSILSGLCVAAAYSYIGGAWLVLKTEGQLQVSAVKWARSAGRISLLGVIAVCVVNPLVNPGVFDKWFDYPLVMFVLLIPVLTVLAFIVNDLLLKRLPLSGDRYSWAPLILAALIFVLCFIGLGFSFYPFIVPGRLTIAEAASAPESLAFIFVGAAIVVPVILLYTIFAYRVFRGKATDLKYY